MSAPDLDASREHATRHERFASEVRALEASGLRTSMLRLGLFIAFVAMVGSGIARASYPMLGIGAGALALFFVAVVVHARLVRRRDRAETRRDIHARHLKRIALDTEGLPEGTDLFDVRHPYVSDLDLAGPRSIFARICVAHTRRGHETLAGWLGAPATGEIIVARQAAVAELAADIELRQELEAAVLDTGSVALDGRPFLELCQLEPFVTTRLWLRLAAIALPTITIVLFWFSGDTLPSMTWMLSAAVSGSLAWWAERHIGPRYQLLSSRLRFVESFAALLRVAENANWKSPLLVELQGKLRGDGAKPSDRIKELELWTSLLEVRTQGLIYVLLSGILLWDVHCLARVERWVKRSGGHVGKWMEVLGEIEALASLATLLSQDPGAILPEIAEPNGKSGNALEAVGLAHPLIAPDARVANDIQLEGRGHALVVTGSNMAGKSTLLRALGTGIALALAGGPVIAEKMRLMPVRLRASMRIADSLQAGSSYFHAELERLRIVIAEAEDEPPILFLLDELLRGTNARARHRGARAVVLHLLARGGLGIVATHDVALSELEDELGGKVRNLHFTDVIEDGEMIFDYRLRPGVVRTSNALRLLSMAGVEVEVDDAVWDEEEPAPPLGAAPS